MAKIVLNQEVWIVPSGYYRPNDKRAVRSDIVSKVGKKYFALKDRPYDKFSLETLEQVTNYNYKDQVYLSHQDILDEREYIRLQQAIKEFLSKNIKELIALDQLQEVALILDIE